MNSLSTKHGRQPKGWPEIEWLYYEILTPFTRKRRTQAACVYVDRLEAFLAVEDPKQEAILGQEGLALVFEARGDLGRAIAYREGEIRLSEAVTPR